MLLDCTVYTAELLGVFPLSFNLLREDVNLLIIGEELNKRLRFCSDPSVYCMSLY